MERTTDLETASLRYISLDIASMVLFYLDGVSFIKLWGTGDSMLRLRLEKMVKALDFIKVPVSSHLPSILRSLPHLDTLIVNFDHILPMDNRPSCFDWAKTPNLREIRIFSLALSKWTIPNGGLAELLPKLEIFELNADSSHDAYQLRPFPDTLLELKISLSVGPSGPCDDLCLIEFLPSNLLLLEFDSNDRIPSDMELQLPDSLTHLHLANPVENLDFLRDIADLPLEYLHLELPVDYSSGDVLEPTSIDLWSVLPPSLKYFNLYTDASEILPKLDILTLPRGLKFLRVLGNGGRTNFSLKEFWNILPQLEFIDVGGLDSLIRDDNVSLVPKTYREASLDASATEFSTSLLPPSLRKIHICPHQIPSPISNWSKMMLELIHLHIASSQNSENHLILGQLPLNLKILNILRHNTFLDPDVCLPIHLNELKSPAELFYKWFERRLPSFLQKDRLNPSDIHATKGFMPNTLKKIELSEDPNKLTDEVPLWMIPIASQLLPTSLKSIQFLISKPCKLSAVGIWCSHLRGLQKLERIFISVSNIDRFYTAAAASPAEFDVSFPIPEDLPENLKQLMITGDTDASGLSRVPKALERLWLFENRIPFTEAQLKSLPKTLVVLIQGRIYQNN